MLLNYFLKNVLKSVVQDALEIFFQDVLRIPRRDVF